MLIYNEGFSFFHFKKLRFFQKNLKVWWWKKRFSLFTCILRQNHHSLVRIFSKYKVVDSSNWQVNANKPAVRKALYVHRVQFVLTTYGFSDKKIVNDIFFYQKFGPKIHNFLTKNVGSVLGSILPELKLRIAWKILFQCSRGEQFEQFIFTEWRRTRKTRVIVLQFL